MDRHPQFHNPSSSRYVSFRPPPPQPPHFSKDTGIYPPPPHRHYHQDHNHHHNHLPPPPLPPTYRIPPGPPPPPPQPLLNHHSPIHRVIHNPPPPPHPYHLHHHHQHQPPQPSPHSQLDFNNHLHHHHHRPFVDDEPIPLHHRHPIDFSQSPRVPDRIPYDDDNRRLPFRFSEFDDDSRHVHRRPILDPVKPPVVCPKISFEFDRRRDHRSHNFERVDRFRREPEVISSPRFREQWSEDIRSRADDLTPELREDRQFLDNTRDNCRHMVSDDSRLERERSHRKHVVSDGDKFRRDIIDRGNHQIHPPIRQRELAPKSSIDGRLHGLVPQEELFRKGKVEEEAARPGLTLEELPGSSNDFRNDLRTGVLSGRNKFSDGSFHGLLPQDELRKGKAEEESARPGHTLEELPESQKDLRNDLRKGVLSVRNKFADGRLHGLVPQEELFRKGGVEEESTRPGYTVEELPGLPTDLRTDLRNGILSGRNKFSDGYERGKNRFLEAGRYADQDRKEEISEFVHTPRKRPVQKKSAFLRMQPVKSNFRNKNEPPQEYCKGKEKMESADHGSSQRGKSPVHLDVSFKSNALVAKAVVTPSRYDKSQSDDVKSRMDIMPNLVKESSKMDIDESCAIGSSVNGKDEKHSENNYRARRNIILCPSDTGVSNSQACFNMGDISPKDGAPSGSTAKILDKTDTPKRFAKTPSPTSRKMRKIIIPNSAQTSFQIRTEDGEENADILLNRSPAESMPDKCSKDLGKEMTSDGGGTGSPQQQLVAPLVNEAEHVSASDAVLEEFPGDYVSDKLSSHTGKRKRSELESAKSSRQSRMIDDSHVDTHVSIHDAGAIPSSEGKSSDISFTEGLDVSQSIIPVSVDDIHQEDSVGAAAPVQVSVDATITASDGVTAHYDQMSKNCAMTGTNNASTVDDGFIKRQESSNITDASAAEMIDLENPENEAFLSPEMGILNETKKAKITGQPLSSSEDFQSSDIPSDVATSSNSAGNPLTCDNDITTNAQDLDSVANVDERNAVKQDCSCSSGVLHEDGTSRESLKASPSVNHSNVFSVKEFFPQKDRMRKAEDHCEDLGSTIAETDGGPVLVESVSLLHPVQQSDIIDKEGAVSAIGCSAAAPPSTDEGSPMNMDSGRRFCSDAVTSLPISVDVHSNVAPLTFVQKQIVLSPSAGFSDSTSSLICEMPLLLTTQECNRKMPPSSVGCFIPPSEEAGPSCIDSGCQSLALGCSSTLTVEREASKASNYLQLAGDSGNDDDVKCESVRIDCCLVDKQPVLPDTGHSAFSSGSGNDHKEAGNSSMVVTNLERDVLEFRTSGRVSRDENSSAEFSALYKPTYVISDNNIQTVSANPGLLAMETNLDKHVSRNDVLPPISDSLPPSTESTADGGISMLLPMVKTLPLVSAETSTVLNPIIQISRAESAIPEASVAKSCVPKQNSNQTPVVEELSLTSSSLQHSQKNHMNLSSNVSEEDHQPSVRKAGSLQLPNGSAKKTMLSTVSINPSKNERKHHLSHTSTKVRSASSHLTAAKRPSTKPRTWCRTESTSTSSHLVKKPFGSSAPPKPSRKATPNGASNSYIRKGNSLVRNPTSAFPPRSRVHGASFQQLNHSVIDEGRCDQSEMLRTTMLPSTSGLSSCNEVSGPVRSSPSAGQLSCTEIAVSKSGHDIVGLSSNPETDLDKIVEDRSPSNDASTCSSNAKKILYLKRKSNQLVAASNSSEHCVSNMDSSAPSDNYYKRSKHQLVRASSESHLLQTVAVPDDSSNSEEQQTLHIHSDGNRSKRQLRRVSTRTFRPHKFSLVWKLCNTESAKKSVNPLRYHNVLPQLLPWKRATYWRSFWRSSANLSNHSPSLTMSQKLLSSRKRGVVYTRSGFSIRRSKVVSLAGSSLKWSKSIERRSKKTNKEVAIASARMASNEGTKHRCYGVNSSADSHKTVDDVKPRLGERIFRIGSLRYKMDPSKRTLVRIPDKEPSSSGDAQPGTGISKCYVPKRLLIGTDEYVRIGNGNQLIRDPKRRTRVLASEKVRWSLHTARTRLARKRKYCLFFTRFGKCHKDEGKCPYIHDPSKTAICTRFLNGLCSDPNCKLTHQIIPERMPDCSFFLQGMCSNENCPYRHVNVNPKADICGGFLKGYCAEGDECRKKHTYICPIYDATGKCPEGSKCKLYHPRKGKGKKKKRSRDQINRGRRYFGMQCIAEPETVSMKHQVVKRSENGLIDGGSPADYISLDVSDDEARENEDLVLFSEHAIPSEIEPFNGQLGNLDELIKPVRLFKLSRGSSPTTNSSDEVAAVPAGKN